MAKFRKRPVVIDADLYKAGMEDGWCALWSDGVVSGFQKLKHDVAKPAVDGERAGVVVPVIRTLEGYHAINPGDWIITGVRGERYPCKPEIFWATYEEIK